ncbi:hypothetical protein [Metabacillus sp. Hm71]|uniref:hypothetical protein n=1 Tax=Metabacillus sp. Hm71 TaxID=3450743 RepID=UPI003F43712D
MREPQPIIGQAWTGRHVIILQCSETNKLIEVYKSIHAPIEPPRLNCAETLSQLISIGYRIHAMSSLPNHRIQYVLVLF